MKCVVCDNPNTEIHHWKSRGSGGGDESWNCMPLCRTDHMTAHRIGMVTFSERYFQVTKWLFKNGWDFDEHLKKWRHE